MKKFFLLHLLLVSMVCGLCTTANAQYSLQTLGARLIVNSPYSLQGTKKFTYSSDPAYTGPWGGSLTGQFYFHQPLVHISDSLVSGKLSPSDSAKVSGKWALVFRGGGFFFSDKAYYCFKAGAKGVIIVNNVPGADPIGMAANTTNLNYTAITCPVLMVSNPDGIALNNALYAGLADTVSLSQWGFNLPHDLAMVPGSSPTPYLGALPLSQITAHGGNVPQYNMYNGGFVANIGNTPESEVVVNTNLYFTPTSGIATLLRHDTTTIGSITVADSVLGNYSDSIYKPVPTVTGRYDVMNYITFNNADSDTPDDTLKSYSYVTDSVFCLGRWDAVKHEPVSTGYVKFATGSTSWGPLFYVNDGPYQAVQVQLGVNDGDTSKHDLHNANSGSPLFVTMFRWVDGTNGQPMDSIVQYGELVPEGIATKTFTTLDTNDQKFTVSINDINGTAGSKAYLSAGAYYFFVADLGSGLSMDVDGYTNYFGRMFTTKNIGNSAQSFAPVANDDVQSTTPSSNPGGAFAMIPFVTNSAGTISNINALGTNGINLVDQTPSFALYTSKSHQGVSVKNVVNAKPDYTIYPNPAAGTDIHVKMDLTAKSSVVYFNIFDNTGRSIYKTVKYNVQSDDFTFPTSTLPAGQYYIATKTDAGSTGLPFTILSK